MYALKLITEREGRKVEEVHCLGEMYRLEFYPESENKDIVARVEHTRKDAIPSFDINRTDHAYITTVTGDTVRVISRGRKACQ
ncbi:MULTISPECIES: hypothetical protein [Proteus]|uniref:Uncharacterized protein n=1 Tax=Proteus vulgaris TaxID=585 RepID=A0A379F9R3_PROVU|nr:MULTISPECIES: hypothetical protein [Proteus]AYY82140.1 hypothetical protein EGX81_15185 [Proteus vulgaris]MBI6406287.1 hypothetical protein [Proteus sp. PR00208]MBJ2111151.1 hypothetical protein [Proteus terrae]MBJ2134755.1 hypothetical protein [Proteus terrae]MCX2589482.1 hypothetical protein [Proteus penneri]